MATHKAYQRNIRDNDLRVASALPAAASTTVNGTAIDAGAAGFAKAIDRSSGGLVELVVVIPDLSTTILPDTRTLTATIETSDQSNFSSATTLGTKVFTGAAGAGAAGGELRVPLPSTGLRYYRAKYVSGASTTDASALSGEFCFVF